MTGLLTQKKIILGVTGSIAAYKAVYLTRLCIRQGAEVRVIMTPAATEFVSPLTFSTLSKNPVYTEIIDEQAWNNHVELGLWGDLMLIAPATASTMAKCAHGICDSMLVATYLSAKCPVFFAPAMDLDMWKHGSTKENIKKLQEYGNRIIPVGHGELASGLSGAGRMAEPEEIIDFLSEEHTTNEDFTGREIVVNAGPTHEPIDPVRYIGNHSTGKMGIRIAEEFARRGGRVTLILGPTQIKPQDARIDVRHTVTADEMYHQTRKAFDQADIAVFAAAVADYTPAVYSDHKIKKNGESLSITLKRTRDIAYELGQLKKDRQVTVGFALETEQELDHARTKRSSKNFDFIVMNSLQDEGAGFKHDTNRVSFIFPDNKVQQFELKSKKEVARDIVDTVLELLKKK